MTIRLEHATVNGSNAKTLLHDISLTIADGSLTLLIGETGSGKTTLLSTLAGLIQPATGALYSDEQHVWSRRSPSKAYLMNTGVVFQMPESQLFAGTVEKELQYSLRPTDIPRSSYQQRSIQALSELGLPQEMLKAFPHHLSGGQKRRVGLSTTFVTDTPWLFLDEPTAGLDSGSIRQLTSLLREKLDARRQRGGIVIATHDLDTFFPLADQVVVLQSGCICGVYTPQALCQNPSVLLNADIGLPSAVETAQELASVGIHLDSIPLDGAAFAESLLDAVRARPTDDGGVSGAAVEAVVEEARSGGDDAASSRTDLQSSGRQPIGAGAPGGARVDAPAAADAPATSRGAWLRDMDVRAKWLSYFLLSVGFLAQRTPLSFTICSLIVAATVSSAGIEAKKYRATRPFLYMAVFTVLLSGFSVGASAESVPIAGPITYSLQHGLTTLIALYKIFLILVLSVILTTTTTTLQLKQGLERLWPGDRRPALWDAFTLGSALTLRFIPVMSDEWKRFSLVMRARAKSTAKPGSIRLRDVPAVLIPMILGAIQLGDTLATAMEARGYSELGMVRSAATQAPWTRRDKGIALCSVLLTCLLVALRYV